MSLSIDITEALLATASVIISFAFSLPSHVRPGSFLSINTDLLRLTCLLWLADAALPNSNHKLVASLVFFGTICANCVNLVRWPYPTSRRFSFFRVARLVVDSVVSNLAPCALAVLWTDIVFCQIFARTSVEDPQYNFNTRRYILVTATATTVFFLSVWRQSRCCSFDSWHKQPHRTVQVDLESENRFTTSDVSSLDESYWYRWSTRQVTRWLENEMTQIRGEIMMLDGDGDCDSAKDDEPVDFPSIDWLLTVFKHEQIMGKQLDRISMADFRSFNVPFGFAQQLLDKIQHLVEKYPNPDRLCRANQETKVASNPYASNFSWLQQHDHIYNNRLHISDPHGMTDQSKPTTQSTKATQLPDGATEHEHTDPSPDVAVMDEELQKYAQRLLREQFGLELPQLRQRRGRSDQTPAQEGHYRPDLSVSSSALQVQHEIFGNNRSASAAPISFGNEDTTIIDLPPDILSNMPSHISEIVRTRPDIVQTVLQARKKKQERTAALRPLFEKDNQAGEQLRSLAYSKNFESFGSENDDDGNERAKLLHASASQYKSIV